MILGLDGVWGLKGWQWLFICEGVPTVLLGLVVLFLSDRWPGEGKLVRLGRACLAERPLAPRADGSRIARPAQLMAGAEAPLLLGLVYFGNAAANYGLGFWLPTIVKGLRCQ